MGIFSTAAFAHYSSRTPTTTWANMMRCFVVHVSIIYPNGNPVNAVDELICVAQPLQRLRKKSGSAAGAV